MAAINDVAEALISDRGRRTVMGTMAFQKLAYLAQGVHLATHGVPLFDDPLVAWPSGPVCLALQEAYKGEHFPAPGMFGDPSKLTVAESSTVEVVVSRFSHLPGQTLSEITVAQLPWLHAHSRATDEDPYPVLSTEVMASFFRAWADAPRNPTEYANRFAHQYGSLAGVQHDG